MTTIPYFHDDPDYLHALVTDYLELMGEEPIGNVDNNILTEYDHRYPNASNIVEDSTTD